MFERGVENSRRVGESEKLLDKWETLYCGVRKSIVLLEDSQAPPASPSDKSSVKVKILEWLEIVAWDGDSGIVIFWITVELEEIIWLSYKTE
jgi:hypothetical protein